jgi:GntR family transcriptional regulator
MQLENIRGVPRYVQLRELLRDAIDDGRWGADEPLPTEAQLQVQYQLSRSTVRQALADLVRDGLLVRFPGRGTFARRPNMVLGMRGFLSFSADLTARGIQHSRRVVTLECTTLPAAARQFVPELAEVDVVRVFEVRSGDGRPMVVFNNYFPLEKFAFLLENEHEVKNPNGSLRDYVKSHGITYVRAIGEVNAVQPTVREAKLLELESRSPVVEISTKTYDVSGDVVEYSRGLIRADRYPLTLESHWGNEPTSRNPEDR